MAKTDKEKLEVLLNVQRLSRNYFRYGRGGYEVFERAVIRKLITGDIIRETLSDKSKKFIATLLITLSINEDKVARQLLLTFMDYLELKAAKQGKN